MDACIIIKDKQYKMNWVLFLCYVLLRKIKNVSVNI